jgi:YfiH family protein
MSRWRAALADGSANPVDVIRAASLDGVAHGFLGSRGGVSKGLVAGLQMGLNAGDDDADVRENRRLGLEAACPGTRLVTVKQVHSSIAVIADTPWKEDARPEADAIVTATPGLALAIVTADCAPVLFADRVGGVIGAAHAGWRGAHGGVLEATVAKMEELGAKKSRIAAAIGPCIAQASYEVGQEFRDQFDPADAPFFAPGKPGKWQFDLEAYVAYRLTALGLGKVEKLGLDTYSAPDRFYSHRRSVHAGEPTYGRQFSLMAL